MHVLWCDRCDHSCSATSRRNSVGIPLCHHSITLPLLLRYFSLQTEIGGSCQTKVSVPVNKLRFLCPDLTREDWIAWCQSPLICFPNDNSEFGDDVGPVLDRLHRDFPYNRSSKLYHKLYYHSWALLTSCLVFSPCIHYSRFLTSSSPRPPFGSRLRHLIYLLPRTKGQNQQHSKSSSDNVLCFSWSKWAIKIPDYCWSYLINLHF